MTPLNRAATALHESLTTADISMNGDLATQAVIAVLKAIREPSEEMVAAGIAQAELCTDDWTASSSCVGEHCWQAMLDVILEGK